LLPTFPGLLIANTDTYWYLGFTENIFRFFPTILDSEDTLRFHGDNERISIDIYHQSVNFYYRIIHNADIMFDHALTNDP
jgi:carboxypeptidase PM20D1